MRIQVPASATLGVRHALCALVILAFVLPACGGRQQGASAEPAVLEFRGSPVQDAEIWLDGQFHIGALRRGIKIKPGAHRLEIRHDDYHTQYLELTVAAGEQRTVRVQLAEILP